MDKDTYESIREDLFNVNVNAQGHLERTSTSAERLERLVHQAEVSMDKLTGSSEWDAFVQIVQSRLEAAKDDYEHLVYELGHPNFSPEVGEMTRQRFALAMQHGVIETLEWITELPREVMDAAEAAGLDGEEPKTSRPSRSIAFPTTRN